ncbi:hypothetical protein LSTR_LSTR006581 [Laodelphax striatellus]|uniref:RNA polymerase II elongation factor ELL N-terminal domain-containing protein n=1 Tax=Laodelphax striatellus TaxID=195883 RepID=A0A482WRW8_LAOST|nr:hypothetical protein LSTR_LSTR006581 [Laodelphax striatellus]
MEKKEDEKEKGKKEMKGKADRLIHMLAVAPYKKPELHAAVQREGLRDKDRNQLTATLSSIAMQRDNTYYLLRHVWNDVSDDWPFLHGARSADAQTIKGMIPPPPPPSSFIYDVFLPTEPLQKRQTP